MGSLKRLPKGLVSKGPPRFIKEEVGFSFLLPRLKTFRRQLFPFRWNFKLGLIGVPSIKASNKVGIGIFTRVFPFGFNPFSGTSRF